MGTYTEDENIKKLTLEKAKEFVVQLSRIEDNNENAHSEEDYLYARFVECCANGLYTQKETIEIGKIVLSTRNLDFDRWCA